MIDAASLGWASGATLIGAAGLRAAWAALVVRERTRRRERRAARRRREFDGQLDAALQWARASHPRLKAWNGTRTFQVVSVVDEARYCRSYRLAPVDGRPLPKFAPGQHLTFHLPVEHGEKPLVRCYSISDRPHEQHYRVTVKWALPPAERPELPPGRGSGYFYERIGAGSTLEVEAPQGAFFLDPTDASPVVLVGAGVGVTPLVSMAAALGRLGDPRSVHFFAGFRNSDEHVFCNELAKLAAQHDRLQLTTAYSQPLTTDQLGRDYDLGGHITPERLRAGLPSNNFRFYLCGPPAMMQSLAPALLAWGVPREHIRFEAFGPASVRGFGNAVATPCNVQFAKSEQLAVWDAGAASLLELAESAGVELDSGCRAGSCGQCRVSVLAGQVTHAKPPGVELIDGECLACIAQPRGDVVVDA